MRFTAQTSVNGVSERHFTLGGITGVLWSSGTADRPLVLLAHGGGQHKKAPGVVARAHRFVTECGCTAVAIDAPGHGDRTYTRPDAGQARFDWHTTLDALQPTGPVGFWGVSMGTAIGLPFVMNDPRITAAVFGLAGDDLAGAARRVTVPVQFLLQWDDELVPRESALALFDAFASREKTLHANPGAHVEVPRFEVDSSGRFFTRHLVRDEDDAARVPRAD